MFSPGGHAGLFVTLPGDAAWARRLNVRMADMVRAYHLIMCAYGFWLPNDPRGSWSTEVHAPHLRRFGPATKTDTRRSVASVAHDRALRIEAKKSLKYPPVRLNGEQARAIARGFAEISHTLSLTVWACAILPDHVHLVTKRHALSIEAVAGHLKRAATRQLVREGIHPQTGRSDSRGRTPSPWAEDAWPVFLNSDADIRDRIEYVNRNPIKAGLKPQHWHFVQPHPS